MESALRQPSQQWQIECGVALSFSGREVGAITSQLGTIWVTQPGTMTDYFLRAGERFEIAPNTGHIVVEAISARARIVNTLRTPRVQRAQRPSFRAYAAHALRRTANWIDIPRSPISTC